VPPRGRSPTCGGEPRRAEYKGSATPLRDVWVALRNNVGASWTYVTLADVIADRIPSGVKEWARSPTFGLLSGPYAAWSSSVGRAGPFDRSTASPGWAGT
jgi:hypothetical protein